MLRQVLIGLCGLALVLPAHAESGAATAAISPESKAVAGAHAKVKEDLPNFHEVYPYLYRGGEPTNTGLERLKDMGVKTIIDLRGSEALVKEEAAYARKLGMESINLPMSSKPPTKQQVETMMSKITAAEKDPGRGAVFVHCAHGSDRTGAMIGIFRVLHDGWDYDTAYKEMRKYWFTPKFTQLSGTVREYAAKK